MHSTALAPAPQERFAQVPLWWYELRPRLTWRQLAIGTVILAHYNPKAPDSCFPSIELLSEITGVDRRNVRSDIGKLAETGAIYVVRGKRGTPNRYFIGDSPRITTTPSERIATTPSDAPERITTPAERIATTPDDGVTTTPLTDQLTYKLTDQASGPEKSPKDAERERLETAAAKAKVYAMLRGGVLKRMPGAA